LIQSVAERRAVHLARSMETGGQRHMSSCPRRMSPIATLKFGIENCDHRK
jgi:hypothetical protein